MPYITRFVSRSRLTGKRVDFAQRERGAIDRFSALVFWVTERSEEWLSNDDNTKIENSRTLLSHFMEGSRPDISKNP